MLNRRAIAVLLCLATVAIALYASRVSAHDMPFYETWKMPDAPHVSCCNQNDCAPVLKARQDPMGIWHAQRASDGKWFAIPPEKVEVNRDSPDGQSHLCVLNDRVLCFLPAAGI